MYVRPLTAGDKIKQVKELANKSIKEQSKELTKQITKLRKSDSSSKELRRLEREREHLQELLIKGSPVTVKVLGDSILLDYELLKQMYRSLAKHQTVRAGIDGFDLRIDYQKSWNKERKGYVVLHDVNSYRSLAGSLPIIGLYGDD